MRTKTEMTNEQRAEAASRLEEIVGEMMELLGEAGAIIQDAAPDEYRRAKAYCLAHLECALHADHGYLNRSDNLASYVEAVRGECDDEEDDDLDEDAGAGDLLPE